MLKKGGIAVLVLMFIGLGLAGVYSVDSGEEAVVLRFGKHTRTVTNAGLKWRIPVVESVRKEKVSEIKRLEFGFREMRPGDKNRVAEYMAVADEALMLTGDDNLVNVEFVIQFQIIDIEKYVFNVDDPIGTIRLATESALRRIVASNSMDDVLTENKSMIQESVRDYTQAILDRYDIGVSINAGQLHDVYPPAAVEEAFKDVIRARDDKAKKINQAQTKANEIIPVARGNAAKLMNEAEGYKERRINEAEGDVAKFIQILERYLLAKEVTRTRMYYETMEEILPGIDKYFIDSQGNTLQFLPLTQEMAR